MSVVAEILRAAGDLGVECRRMEASAARSYIDRAILRFAPAKVEGHLAVGHDSDVYPVELAEFDYSHALQPGLVRLFFDQASTERNEVVEMFDGRRLSPVMQQCFGIEYFASDVGCEYLIAVNWYVVEVAGVARDWLRNRYGESRE